MIPFTSLHICESEYPDCEKKRVYMAEYEKQAFYRAFFFMFCLFYWGKIMTLQFTTITFVIVMLVLFQLAPGNLRKYVLLTGSLGYILVEGGITGLAMILLVTVIAWATGRLFFAGKEPSSEDSSRKIVAFAVIILFATVLFTWKYLPLLARALGRDISDKAWAAVPIGLSFYTFQAISYVADLYTGKMKPLKSPVKFAIYMTWFPKWMSGPIERAGTFIDQLKYSGNIRSYSFRRITVAAPYFVWGLVMKLLIADKIAGPVDAAFADIGSMGPLALMLASLLYTLQIYCDFAGYTNIAIGISKVFGIDLTQNFMTPYFAENITDFWRRWHISLSNFLRDYVYIPLGGNRKGAFRKHLNTVIVFFICGMWHGAGLSFIVWGLLHGVFSIIAALLKKSRLDFLVKGGLGRVITFIAVSFAWIFFRADSMSQAMQFIRGMVPAINANALMTGFAMNEGKLLGLGTMDWWIAGIALAVLVILDVLAYRKDTVPPAMMIDKLSDNRRIVILAAVLSLVLIFGEYGAGEDIRKFVYMNF